MNKLIYNFIIVLVIVTIIDMIWISTFAKKKYTTMISSIQNKPMMLNYKYAIMCYLIIAMLVFLLINKNFNYKELFLTGFFTYAIYDLTNASIFTDWDSLFGLYDMIWGGLLFASSGFVFNKLINK